MNQLLKNSSHVRVGSINHQRNLSRRFWMYQGTRAKADLAETKTESIWGDQKKA